MVESHKERNVYEHNVVVKIMDYKISAIDVHGKYLSYYILIQWNETHKIVI